MSMSMIMSMPIFMVYIYIYTHTPMAAKSVHESLATQVQLSKARPSRPQSTWRRSICSSRCAANAPGSRRKKVKRPPEGSQSTQ